MTEILVGLVILILISGVVYCIGKALEDFNYLPGFYDTYRGPDLSAKIGYLLWALTLIGMIITLCWIIGSIILALI